MVIAAAHNNRLRRVTVENTSVVLGLLLERRWHLVAQRQRTTCQLHALLGELVPAGAARHLTSKEAAALLRRVTPAGVVSSNASSSPVNCSRTCAEGKSKTEALRALKRQLSDVIYRRLVADERAPQVVRGGQTGDKPKAA